MRILMIGCLLLVLFDVSSGENAESQKTTQALLQPIREIHAKQENIGFSFVMTHRGREVLRDFAGLANVAYDQPIDSTIRFSIMSITKAFTGLLVLRAIARNELTLHGTVSEYLPEYSGDSADKITIAMLLAHTSGIPHTKHPERKALYVEHFECAADSLSLIASKELAHTPGEAYLYSSSGYNLLATILEKVSGLCVNRLAQQRLFTDLQLQDTGYLNAQKPIKHLVRNYSYVDMWNYKPVDELQLIPTWDFSYNMGGGNMFSTVDDLALLGNILLAKDSLPKINKKLIFAAIQPDKSRWSSGFITTEGEHGEIYITGATPGVQASLYIYPQHDIVFAMLANSWGKGSAGGKLVIDAPKKVVEMYLQTLQ